MCCCLKKQSEKLYNISVTVERWKFRRNLKLFLNETVCIKELDDKAASKDINSLFVVYKSHCKNSTSSSSDEI